MVRNARANVFKNLDIILCNLSYYMKSRKNTMFGKFIVLESGVYI